MIARALFAALPVAMLATTAQAQEQSYDLPPFSAVDVATGIQAEIVESSEQTVVASGVQADLDDLRLDVRDGTLYAAIDRDIFEFIFEGGLMAEFFRGEEGVRLQIAVPALDAATTSSGALVTAGALPNSGTFSADASSGSHIVLTDLATGQVDLSASSGASVRASGTCDAAAFDASSGAHIEAGALACARAAAEASSGASIGLNASSLVEANASSGAHINVSGSPADVDTQQSFGGSVTVN